MLIGLSSSNTELHQSIARDENAEAEDRGNEGVKWHKNGLDKRGIKVLEREKEIKIRMKSQQRPHRILFMRPARRGFLGQPDPTAKKISDTYNYEEKHPGDAIYELGTAPNARVWRTYEAEGRIYDANMVEECWDNVNILLVFASLSSAVVTTFVVQTCQNLLADYVAVSASLLFKLVLIQRAIAKGSSVDAISPSPVNPASCRHYRRLGERALVHQPVPKPDDCARCRSRETVASSLRRLPSGTPRIRSFTRQFRYAGFQKCHIQVIIGLLPVLIHLTLAIFLAGLVVFLHPPRKALSWIICAGTILDYVVYMVVTTLPIFSPMLVPCIPLQSPSHLRRFVPKVS
ncbi:hypothetical protein DFS33DRAFT_1290895 [Desarmillaria ectypa]|nr:hypothetical protein DFS33DRAFT_1290895 [Desarmillaria ectypa]